MNKLTIYISFLLLVLTSCHTQNMMSKTAMATDTSAFSRNPAYEYTIRKDDKISLSIWSHDDMSVGSVYGIYNSNEVYGKWLLVDVNGNITVPKLGDIHIEGLTVLEAEKLLRDRYSEWIVKPVIEVKVLNKEITVMGELKTPGKYLLERDNNTLLDIISKAGDFDFYADKRHVQVVRTVNGTPQKVVINLTQSSADFRENIQVYPGDIIYVPSRKGKNWDKRSGSIVVPIATIISSAVLISTLAK